MTFELDVAHTVFVFDLDDTLYKEADYQLSGISAVCERIDSLYGVDLAEYAKDRLRAGEQDLWGQMCATLNVPASVKESFLWVYRLHVPAISLDDGARETLAWLQSHAAGLAILTDGRGVTQRLKLAALGLSHLPVYISEEHESSKPETTRFLKVQDSIPADSYIYVGDNPAKDFVAPRQLGWTTIGLRGDVRNIHSQDCTHLARDCLPDIWISSLAELRLFCALSPV